MPTRTLKCLILLILVFNCNKSSTYLQVLFQDSYSIEDIQDRNPNPKIVLSPDFIIHDISGNQYSTSSSYGDQELQFKTVTSVKKRFESGALDIDLGGVEILESTM